MYGSLQLLVVSCSSVVPMSGHQQVLDNSCPPWLTAHSFWLRHAVLSPQYLTINSSWLRQAVMSPPCLLAISLWLSHAVHSPPCLAVNKQFLVATSSTLAPMPSKPSWWLRSHLSWPHVWQSTVPGCITRYEHPRVRRGTVHGCATHLYFAHVRQSTIPGYVTQYSQPHFWPPRLYRGTSSSLSYQRPEVTRVRWFGLNTQPWNLFQLFIDVFRVFVIVQNVIRNVEKWWWTVAFLSFMIYRSMLIIIESSHGWVFISYNTCLVDES